MNRSEATFLISEARDISRQLGTARTIEEKADLLARADELEHRVTDQRRSRDQEALNAQLAALGTPSPIAGQSRAKTPHDVLVACPFGLHGMPSFAVCSETMLQGSV